MSFTKQDIAKLVKTLNTVKHTSDYRVISFDGGNTYYKVYENGEYEII